MVIRYVMLTTRVWKHLNAFYGVSFDDKVTMALSALIEGMIFHEWSFGRFQVFARSFMESYHISEGIVDRTHHILTLSKMYKIRRADKRPTVVKRQISYKSELFDNPTELFKKYHNDILFDISRACTSTTIKFDASQEMSDFVIISRVQNTDVWDIPPTKGEVKLELACRYETLTDMLEGTISLSFCK